MALSPDRKLFLGARLKRLRRELGHTQSRMAEDLGVSPSYLNLLERNQRPVTAQVLLRLAEAYDLDLKSLSGDSDSVGAAGLGEVFADGLFRDLAVPRQGGLGSGYDAPAGGDAWGRRREQRAGDWDAPSAKPAPEAMIGSAPSWRDPEALQAEGGGFGFDAPFTRPVLQAPQVKTDDLAIPSDWDAPARPAPAPPARPRAASAMPAADEAPPLEAEPPEHDPIAPAPKARPRASGQGPAGVRAPRAGRACAGLGRARQRPPACLLRRRQARSRGLRVR